MIDWYYRDTHQLRVGPLTTEEFDVCVVVGEIRPETSVWRSGLPDWTTYEDLLAQAIEAATVSRGRQSASARPSSSYHRMIALGRSPVHRHPARSRVTTSGCTPYGVPEPLWTDEQEKYECVNEPRPETSLDQQGADAMWLGRQLIRVALAGAFLMLVHFFVVERVAGRFRNRPTEKGEPTVVMGPMEATLSANFPASPSPTAALATP